jgi:hypothetical protein
MMGGNCGFSRALNRDEIGKTKSPTRMESGLAVESAASFSRGAYFQRMTIVAKPTRASVRV